MACYLAQKHNLLMPEISLLHIKSSKVGFERENPEPEGRHHNNIALWQRKLISFTGFSLHSAERSNCSVHNIHVNDLAPRFVR